jgi:hypothetical protein
MSTHHLGPIDMDCDAPSYSIVRASRRLGLRDPEDVRWCQMSHLQDQQLGRSGFAPWAWKLWASPDQGTPEICFCGQALPMLELCTFTFDTGREECYFLGQCNHCRTVFWKSA